MSDAFTPAPWAMHPGLARVDAFENNEPVPVCEMLWPTDLRSESVTEANARLIAAAPDLYEACRLFQVAANMSVFDDSANAALAKAHDAAETALARARGYCSGHVARDDDKKVCRHCGTHVDEYRDEPQDSGQ